MASRRLYSHSWMPLPSRPDRPVGWPGSIRVPCIPVPWRVKWKDLESSASRLPAFWPGASLAKEALRDVLGEDGVEVVVEP